MNTWQTSSVVAAAAMLSTAVSAPLIQAQQPAGDVQVFEIRPNVHQIAGAGANITAHIGPDGVVLVDSGSAERSAAVVAAIRRLTPLPIRYIINTGPGGDHIGGNEALAEAGVSLWARRANAGGGGGGVGNATSNMGGAAIVGREELLARMSAPGFNPGLPVTGWPTETFTRKYKDLFLNREVIQVIRQPPAHSDSDVIVMFRQSDVIATGDIVDIDRFPHIDLDKGGTIQGEIEALNALLDLTVPSIPLPWLDEGGTRVVPGHGRAVEEAEIVEYRDMVTVIRDRVQDMITRGLTLEQIRTANPTLGYRTRYGAESGPWTTTMFVDAVYRSLMAGGTR
ncbi:MAG: MBL fold metallo-hydrolase [Acidobacteria bacterium]|nr:MBL fold metallo-hydrolase [Acidobacteriota bacterium]